MKQKIKYIDYLRTFAIIGVVIIHVSAGVVGDYASYSTNDWLVSSFYNSLFRWCVPIFVMISGALLLNDLKTDTLFTFYKKRAVKVIIPLVFWGIVYYIYINRFQLESITFKTFYVSFLKGPVYYPLWFLYMIIFLYLITPFIKKIINKLTNRQIKWFLIIWFSIISIYNTIFLILDKVSFYTTEISIYIGQFAAGFLYSGYYILGYYLTKFDIKSSKVFNIIGLISLAITFFGTYIISASNNLFGSYFMNYLNFNTVLVSIMIFLYFKNANLKSHTILKVISTYSFGIYLIHVIIMEYIFSIFKVDFHYVQPLIFIPIFTLLVLVLSLLFSLLISKIPIVKRIMP